MSKTKGNVLLAFTLLITAFIFSQSALSAVDSSQESGSLLEVLMKLAACVHLPIELTEHMIRKMAHFIEFMVYGVFLSWTVHEKDKGFRGNIWKILFLLLIVPLIDETIQYSSPGRSAEVRDVLLDYSGALTGFAVNAAAVKIRSVMKHDK